jgi:predicted MFS family arabinose efflux permease
VRWTAEYKLMLMGGALAALALVLGALQFPWYGQVAVFALLGFGFYLLHGCIQVHVTDLSPTARGAAASMHSSAFFLGQAVGPVLYGFGYASGGLDEMMIVGAGVVMIVAVVCSRLLRHRSSGP